MPLSVQMGKQRVLQGLPLVVWFYAVGEPRGAIYKLARSPMRLRSLTSGKLFEVSWRLHSPYSDHLKQSLWWSLGETDDLPPGIYSLELATEVSSFTSSPTTVVFDKESFDRLLKEENDEAFDDNVMVSIDSKESLQSLAREVISTHPAASAFQAAALLEGNFRNRRLYPFAFTRSSPLWQEGRSISRARLRYAFDAFFSDFFYFAPFQLQELYSGIRTDVQVEPWFAIEATPENSVTISAKSPIRLASLFKRFETQADIAWLARIHPQDFHSSVEIGPSFVRLSLLITANHA